MLNLDTNVVLFALRGELKGPEERLLSGSAWAISSIVLWEIGKLAELGRIEFDLDNPQFREFVRELTVLPIGLEECRAISRLDFSSDPADEIIAATSLARDIPLLTRDRRLLRSKIVPLAT